MKYRVVVSEPAKAEADEAYAWISQYSLVRAQKWFNGLFKAIASLDEYPERYPLAPEAELFNREIRQMLYGKRRGVYRVLFEIQGEIVQVSNIRHGARRFVEPE
jgi:plasmid stabilization system protein ParE